MVQRIKTGMIADGAVTTAKMNDEVENLFSFRNRVINGAMEIDQRNAGSSVNYAFNQAGANQWIADRWTSRFFSFTSGTLATIQQVNDAPSGFSKSIKVTAAQNNAASSGLGGFFSHAFEGLNVVDFINENGGFVACTLSFWVKASKTGIMSVNLETTGAHYVTSVTINSANTWENKTVSFPVSGACSLTKDNTQSFSIQFGIINNGSWLVNTPNQWNDDNNRGVFVSNQTNFISTTGDSIQITGVQLEKGTTATPFERRPYTMELALCQRYFSKSYLQSEAPGTASSVSGSIGRFVDAVSPYASIQIFFPQTMRVVPTVTLYNPSTGTAGQIRTDTKNLSAGISAPGPQGCFAHVNNVNVDYTSDSTRVHFTASAEF